MHGIRRVLLAVCAGLALAAVVTADPAAYEGKRIATILFVPREQPLDAEEIFRLLPLKVNSPLRLADVRAAIDRLFATGYYSDIQVDAELRDNGVVLRLITEGNWFVGLVDVTGDTGGSPNKGQLITAARIQIGDLHTESGLRDAVDGIQQSLENNGFYESRVTPRFEYDARTRQIQILFAIDSGSRARFTVPEISGNSKLLDENILNATHWRGWRGWRPVTQRRVQRGLERVRTLYRDQNRLMASVIAESFAFDAAAHTVKPSLRIEAGPTVEARIVGANVSRGKLVQFLPIFEEKTVDSELLVEGERNLRDYFQSQGYFDAEVVHKQQRVVNDKAVIDYLVNTGRRHKLAHVEIRGNRYFDAAALRERIAVSPASLQFRRGRYSDGLRRRDEQVIADLYRENGFRDVKVTSEVLDTYQGRPDQLAVRYTVDEGPQWFVARLELTGVEQLARDEILRMLSSAEGQPFSDFNVAVDRDNILARYFSEGFSGAAFEWSADPAGVPNQVNLRFAITEGQRRYVRQVLISGLRATEPGLVNRNLNLGPGDPLSPTQMAETQRRLYDLGVFARVNMAVQNPDGDTLNKFVLYQMEEAKRYSVSAGLGAELGRIGGGVTSLENPGGEVGFSPRVSFNVSRMNMRGLGHTLSFRSRVSNLQQRGIINYSAPRLRNVPGLNLQFTTLYDKSRDVRTFTSERLEGSVQLSQKLSKATTSLYRFSYRRVRVSDLKIDSLLVPLLSQAARIGMVAGSLIQDRRDDAIEPKKGIYNTVDMGLAPGFLGSEANFMRLIVRNSTYHPVGKNLILARSLNFGAIATYRLGGTFGDVPLPERFFSGGASSHRGFPDNQAGPRDEATGFPLGGRALVIHNAELRFPVLGENIRAVAFHDAGNGYSRVGKISFRATQRDLSDFDYMVHAVGMGVRYRTPVGPLRLDLAYSINGPRFRTCGAAIAGGACGTRAEDRISRFQFHFSIGEAF